MAPHRSSSSQPPSLPRRRPRSSLVTTVAERQHLEGDETTEYQKQQEGERCEEAAVSNCDQQPDRLHPITQLTMPRSKSGAGTPKWLGTTGCDADHDVSNNKCRPSSREKITVVPLDVACGGGHSRSRSTSSDAGPGNNGLLKSLFSSLAWSPRPFCSSSPSAPRPYAAVGEEWRLAATELSRKLIYATRKRDEALAEASRLKYSVAELEKKLTVLESYCRDVRSSLDRSNQEKHYLPVAAAPIGDGEFPYESFLRAVSDSRSAIQHLSRALAAQMSRVNDPPKVNSRLLQLVEQESRRFPSGVGSGSGLLFHLEALLSHAFYEDFELTGFQRPGTNRVLKPRAKAEANMAAYTALRGLSWDDVLSRGTRHYSKSFSRFCDRKMGEVAASAPGGGWWVGAWPEPLLHAFFKAAKGVWLVHLLAWTVHPPVPIFRVEKGAPFDVTYMEEVAPPKIGKGKPPTPPAVRMMVSPGFYALGGVVKCRVLRMHKGNEMPGTANARVNHRHTHSRQQQRS